MRYLFYRPILQERGRKGVLIMRLTIIFLIGFTFQVTARSSGQTVTLAVINMPLEKVCKEIEKQTGYYFVYAKDMNKTENFISIKVDHVSINDALKDIFKGLPYTFQIIDKVVVINTVSRVSQDPKTLTKDPESATSVEGVVLAESGQPLGGASVTIISTGKGVLANAKGEFSLKAVPVNSDILVSYIGYSPKRVPIKDDKFIQIKLAVATNYLDATVIKGYYNTTNRLNTGNVTTVKGEDIQKQPVTDPILALEGRVPGLHISQTSGMPGAYATIQLRGQNFIPTDGSPANLNDPLYIVDGVPFNSSSLTSIGIGGGALGSPSNGAGQGMSPFNSLNTGDIESIQILKDADATAIYGSRGANGVIIITTRKGKIGNTKLDLNVYTGGGKVTRKMKLLNLNEYLYMRHESIRNDGWDDYNDPSAKGFYPDLLIWDTTRSTDWQETIINQPAHFTNAQASLSGGTSNYQFLFGGGYSTQGVLFPGNYADRKASAHASIKNSSQNQRLQESLSIDYVNDINNLPSVDLTSTIVLPPDAPSIYNVDGSLNWEKYNGTATWNNPFANTFKKAKSVTDNLIANLVLNYTIFKDLQLKSSFGYSHSQMNQSIQQPSVSFMPPNDNNPANRFNSIATADRKTWIIEPQVNYSVKISKASLDVLLGATFQQNTQNSIAETAYGFAADALIPNPKAASNFSLVNNDFSLYRYNSFYARAGYNWLDKYLINITARRDGSSRFGPGRQFGNFWAIGTGWIFSAEPFIKNAINVLSFGKLRISYGTTGNDAIADYQYLSTYNPYQYSYQGVSGLTPTRITNPYYQWEVVKKLEGGLELGFKQDRIILSASYYRNRTGNQLVGYALPYIAGFTSVQYNLPANIQNDGEEFTLSTINIQHKNIYWKTSFNISFPRNKLISFPGITNSTYAYTYVVGKSIFSKFVYHYTGVDPQTGLYSFYNKNGDGNLTFSDESLSKPITQKYFGGIQSSLIYKEFQLDVFFQFVKQLGYNYQRYLYMPGGQINMPSDVLARWVTPGDKASIQKYSEYSDATDRQYSYYQQSDGVITDASFIRIKNISLSYQLPNEWKNRMHFQSMRIYLLCQNLFTITKYYGLDPETGGLNLPPVRMMTAGLQINL
jgi:TonB-linked SusC/RagA family outer membrane protein